MVWILRKYEQRKLEDGEYNKKKGEEVDEGKLKLTCNVVVGYFKKRD